MARYPINNYRPRWSGARRFPSGRRYMGGSSRARYPRDSGMASYGYARSYRTGNYKGKSASRPELKCLDCPIGDISTDAPNLQLSHLWQNINTHPAGGSGVTTALNCIGAGDDINNRDGREVILKSVYIRATLDNGTNAAAANTDQPTQNVRLMLIWDKTPNGVLATAGDIFETIGIGTGAVAAIEQPLALKNRYRFKALWDQVYKLGSTLGELNSVAIGGTTGSVSANAAFGTGDTVCPVVKYIKLKNLRSTYASSVAAQNSIMNGALYLFAVGQWDAPQGVLISGNIRLRFTG